MKVSEIKSIKEKNTNLFSAIFSFGFFERKKIWFRVPDFASIGSSADNAFFVLSYVFSLVLNEDLYFDGIVSKKLKGNIGKINKYLGFAKRKIRVTVKKTICNKNKTKGIAQFFTLGVDSFYTLISNRKKIKYLIFVDGYDVPLDFVKLINNTHRKINLVSEKFNTRPIFISTNLRKVSDRIVNWELFHGVGLAAAGLLVSNIKKIYISSSESYLFNVPWGVGPKVDKLWSTEEISFIPYGSIVSRIKKVGVLVRSDLLRTVLKYLRACWKNDYNKNDCYNCSSCEKCLRTQLEFMAYGIKTIPTFKRFRPSILQKIKFPTHIQQQYSWKSMYRTMVKNGIDRKIRDPVASFISANL